MRSESSGKTNPLSIILLMIFMIAALIPAVYNFFLTLVDYSPAHGFFSSPLTGLRNYSQVINDLALFRLIILVILFLFAIIVRLMKNHASLILLAAAAAVFVGAHAYGGFIPHMILTSVPQQYTIGLVFRQSQSMAGQIINTEAGTLSLLLSGARHQNTRRQNRH